MAQYGTRRKTHTLRLLTVLFFLIPFFLFSETSEFTELKYGSDILFLDSPFFVEVKLNDNFPDYYKFLQSPELRLEGEAIELKSSTVSSAYGGLVIKNKYGLTKTGTFRLVPVIVSKRNKKTLHAFDIRIESPPLSANTEFRWKIFSEADNSMAADKIVQGNVYTAVLEGFFYSGDGEAPPEISCRPPENSVLEETFFDAAQMKTETGWRVAACFLWTPLKHGMQELPAPVLSIKNGTAAEDRFSVKKESVFVHKAPSRIGETEAVMTPEDQAAQNSLRQALEEKKESVSSTVNAVKADFETIKRTASEIAELRAAETGALFSNGLRSKRIGLEKELGFENTFPTASSVIKKITAAAFLFFLLFAAIARTKSGKNTILFYCFIAAASVAFGVGIYVFGTGKDSRAVFVPNIQTDRGTLYHIPEISGTAAGGLTAGETVLGLREVGRWGYGKKKGGLGGGAGKEKFIFIGD